MLGICIYTVMLGLEGHNFTIVDSVFSFPENTLFMQHNMELESVNAYCI